MCGIYFSVVLGTEYLPPSISLKNLLASRGPDSFSIVERVVNRPDSVVVDQVSNAGGCCSLLFCGTVLSLRGTSVVTQPLISDDSFSLILFNGEAWTIGGKIIYGNDTEAVFALLQEAVKQRANSQTGAIDPVAQALKSIKGPLTLLFFDGWSIYYARDCIGRRSLLRKQSSSSFELASVSDGSDGWEEVEAGSVFRLTINGSSGPVTAGGYETKNFFTVQRLEPLKFEGSVNRTCPISGGPSLDLKSPSVDVLEAHLVRSLELRLIELPLPHLYLDKDLAIMPSRVAILFSGGLDCTVLARIAHDILHQEDAVDLLNVAFQNPRIQNSKNSSTSPYDACPDRQTARESFAELCKVCPGRRWRLIEVDIPYEEYTAHRSIVTSLMTPHNTEMDLSIASALYFAARGKGRLHVTERESLECAQSMEYTTSAKVLLSGLGADELFGGYQRHATAFARVGITGLLDELELDITRLGKRNCGRDDRVISQWSREVRYPYLDEDLVSWAIEEPVWNKCGFHLAPKTLQTIDAIGPDKLVLRLLARKLGLTQASIKKKRAIQFGARTAKMEAGRRRKGTDILD